MKNWLLPYDERLEGRKGLTMSIKLGMATLIISLGLYLVVRSDENPQQVPKIPTNSFTGWDHELIVPGLSSSYKLELTSAMDIQAGDSNQQESIRVTGNVVLEHFKTADDLIISMLRIDNFEAYSSNGLDLASRNTGSLYFTSQNGKILEFYKDSELEELYENTCKSIAAAFQYNPDTFRHGPRDSLTEEWSLNGASFLRETIEVTALGFDYKKHYHRLPDSAGVKLIQPSQITLSINTENKIVTELAGEMTLRSKIQDLAITSTQSFRLSLTDSRKLNQASFKLSTLQKSNEIIKTAAIVNPKNQEQSYRKVLNGKTKEDIVEQVTKLKDVRTENTAALLALLEAQLYFDPSFSIELLQLLEDSYGSSSFEDQLSVVMGAFVTMPAQNIEDPLLDYANRYTDQVDVSQQTAFALAELRGAGNETRTFLESLSNSPVPDIKTIGLLSLGTLGRQLNHAAEVQQSLQTKLKHSSDEDQLVLIAALGNSWNPANLEVMASYIASGNEDVASQAVFSLKNIPGDQSFAIIQNTLLSDKRAKVRWNALQALGGHLKHPELIETVKIFLNNRPGDELSKIAVSLVAAYEPSPLTAKQTLELMQQNRQYPSELRRYIGELLLTI